MRKSCQDHCKILWRSYQDLAWSCMILQNNLIRSLPRSCQDHYKILSRSYQDLKNIFPRSLKDLVKILPGSCSFLQDLVQDLAWSYQRSCQDYNKDLAKISPRSCQDLTKVFNLGSYMNFAILQELIFFYVNRSTTAISAMMAKSKTSAMEKCSETILCFQEIQQRCNCFCTTMRWSQQIHLAARQESIN